MLQSLLAILIALPAPQSQPAPTPETQARAIVAALVAGEFEEIEAQYSDQMKQGLPPGTLGRSWKAGAAQLGEFKSITNTQTQQAGTNQVVLVTCRFAAADVTFRVVISEKHELAGFASMPPTPPDWSAPPYANVSAFDERPVTLRTGKWELPGFVTVPKSAGKHPAIVLVHGSGPNDADETVGNNKVFKDLAYGLASRGVLVLRYEKRTHKYGGSSGENPDQFTVKEETIDDARSAVALLAAMPEVDASKIFVAGHSEGAYLAPRIAAGHPEIAGVIILAGNVRPLEDLVVDQIRYQSSLVPEPHSAAVQQQIDKALADADASAKEMKNPDLKPGMIAHLLTSAVPASYVLDLRTYHPTDVAATLTIPMLILQGERDYQVTMTDFTLWQQALGKRPSVTFKSYPPLNHLFVAGTGPSRPAEYQTPGHVDRVVVEDIAAWCLSVR